MSVRQHCHLGVYGFCVRDGHILLVRKARGPYRGLLDLPGGKIEFGELPEGALHREILEETGLPVIGQTLWEVKSQVVRYRAQDGVTAELHHLGILFRVTVDPTVSNPLKAGPDGEDSEGAGWVSLASVREEELTPFARWAVRETNGIEDRDALNET